MKSKISRLDYLKVAKVIAIIVVIGGVLNMIGWVLDIGPLKTVLPGLSTMKFIAAISFVFSGAILYFCARAVEGDRGLAQVVLPISALVVLLFMATLLGSFILRFDTGIENLFVVENMGNPLTIVPGRPSLITMVSFVAIALGALVTMFYPVNIKKYLTGIGCFVGSVGLVALLGYITTTPLLYYSNIGFGSPMALITASLFALSGFGFISLGRNTFHEKNQKHITALSIKYRLVILFLATSSIPSILIVLLVGDIGESMAFIIAILLVTVGAIATIVAKSMSDPIQKMVTNTELIAGGNFKIRLQADTQDELGRLALSVNTMSMTLEKMYNTLEDQVRDRTADITQKADELEKTNKYMVGRELKMIELKKEIRELQQKIKGE